MKNVRKIWKVFLLASIAAFTLIGCFQKQNIIADIGNHQISESLYRIFLWESQRGLESLYPNIWKMDNIGGKSPEEVAKERALNSISYYIVVSEKADEMGITLNKLEKDEVKESAQQAFEKNHEINKTYNIKRNDYEMFYSYMQLSEKVIDIIGENYEPSEKEIADKKQIMKENNMLPEEATIIQIYISTHNEQGEEIPKDKKEEAYQRAQQVLEKALKGEDFLELAQVYSEDKDNFQVNHIEYTFKRGTMDENLEKVVFDQAKVGEVFPKIIEIKEGYQIIKVLNKTEATEEEIKQAARNILGLEYAKNELLEMSKLIEVTEKPLYLKINLMGQDDLPHKENN